MLSYLYMKDWKIENDIDEDLFKLSHEYMLEKLKNDCEQVLINQIKLENVISIVQFAEKYEPEKLRKAGLAFIVNNLKDVILTQNFKDLGNETLIEIYEFPTHGSMVQEVFK